MKRKVKIFSLYDYESTEELEEALNSFIAQDFVHDYTLTQSESQVSVPSKEEGKLVNKYRLSLTVILDYKDNRNDIPAVLVAKAGQ